MNFIVEFSVKEAGGPSQFDQIGMFCAVFEEGFGFGQAETFVHDHGQTILTGFVTTIGDLPQPCLKIKVKISHRRRLSVQNVLGSIKSVVLAKEGHHLAVAVGIRPEG